MEYNEHFGLETAIGEIKNQLDRQYGGIDVIKNHARDLFASLSLIVALLSVIKLGDVKYDFYPPGIREGFLIIAGFLYIIIAVVNMNLLQPTTVHSPFKIEKEYLEKWYTNKEPKQILESKFLHYLKAVEENSLILKRRNHATSIVSKCYIAVIILLLAVVFIP